jgi:phosphatidylserine decarboxylase
MRIPLTRDGWKELLILTVFCAVGVWAGIVWLWPVALFAAALWVWGVSFFRDPPRSAPEASDIMVAPADGKIVGVEQLEDTAWGIAPALRIDIFLSVLDAHINRSPCAGVVKKVVAQAGGYLNALRPEASKRNFSRNLFLAPKSPLPGPVVVRQIAGVVARRIVCHCRPGDELACGQRFGMIKFGSRTELYVPADDAWQVAVKLGQKVRAGTTVLLRYAPEETPARQRREVENTAQTTR